MTLNRLLHCAFLFVAACANSATIEEDSFKTPASKQDVRPQDEDQEVEPEKVSPVCGELLRKNCPPPAVQVHPKYHYEGPTHRLRGL